MATASSRLTAVKNYMRVDGTDDDALITSLIEAAMNYLEEAGIPERESDLYLLAVSGLTLHWYDHRDDVGTEASMPLGLRPVIQQLKMSALVEDLTEDSDD